MKILLLITIFCSGNAPSYHVEKCLQEMQYCVEESQMSYEWCKENYDYE